MSKRLLVFLVMIGALLTMIAYTSGPIGAADTATPGASGSAASGSAASGSAAAPTATRAATPTATVAPTVAATATRTGSVVATGTGGATAPSSLPTTGQPHSGSLNVVLIEVLLLALACIGAGIALRQRSKRP